MACMACRCAGAVGKADAASEITASWRAEGKAQAVGRGADRYREDVDSVIAEAGEALDRDIELDSCGAELTITI